MAAIFITIFIVTVCLMFVKLKRRFELGLRIPGPGFIPFIGCTQFAAAPPEYLFLLMSELREKYKRTFRIWFGTSLWVFLHSPEEIKQVLNIDSLGRSATFKQLMPLTGDGLLVSQGPKWKSRRKILEPAFHFKIMESFINSFCQTGDGLVEKLRGHEVVDVSKHIFLCTLDMICETAMGVKINCQDDVKTDYAKVFDECSHFLHERMVDPFSGNDFIYQFTNSCGILKNRIEIIQQLAEKIIKQRRIDKIEKLNSSNDPLEDEIGLKIKNQALLDVLLTTKYDGNSLSDEDIKEEVNTFLFAGVDTTNAAICFTLYNLGKYPQYQDKVIDEIWATIGKDPSQGIKMNQINQLTYLDFFVKESLRFHTVVPLTSRELREETLVGDILLPKGSAVWINLYGLAHDPDLFKNPDEFNPERFSADENGNEITNFSFMPYAGGPRICIGKRYSLLMIKVIIVKMLLNYKVALAQPDEELELISEMVLKSKTGIKLRLCKRLKK